MTKSHPNELCKRIPGSCILQNCLYTGRKHVFWTCARSTNLVLIACLRNQNVNKKNMFRFQLSNVLTVFGISLRRVQRINGQFHWMQNGQLPLPLLIGTTATSNKSIIIISQWINRLKWFTLEKCPMLFPEWDSATWFPATNQLV